MCYERCEGLVGPDSFPKGSVSGLQLHRRLLSPTPAPPPFPNVSASHHMLCDGPLRARVCELILPELWRGCVCVRLGIGYAAVTMQVAAWADPPCRH
jgi:hypothetical protein